MKKKEPIPLSQDVVESLFAIFPEGMKENLQIFLDPQSSKIDKEKAEKRLETVEEIRMSGKNKKITKRNIEEVLENYHLDYLLEYATISDEERKLLSKHALLH